MSAFVPFKGARSVKTAALGVGEKRCAQEHPSKGLLF